CGVPVVALGQAVYSLPGLTFQGPLDEFWLHGAPADPVLFDAFRRVVVARTQINGGFYGGRAIDMAVQGAARRVEQLVTQARAAGCAFSDRRKRHILNEAIVISDVLLALDIFRHPTLALPFPDTARVLGGAGLAVATFVAMFVLEPSVWSWSPWPALLM